MRVVLCHQCWTWVFPNGIACPECRHVISLDEPDPPTAELIAQLGAPVMRLGRVGWDRAKLPVHGELWGTSKGLIYWPRLVDLPNSSIVPWAGTPQPVASWPLFPLWKRPAKPTPEPVAEEDWKPFPTTAEHLAEAFFDVPGAAFFSRENLVKIQCRGRHWTLHRTIGRTVRFTVQSVAAEWKPAWHTFLQQDTWRHLAGRV